MKKYLIIPLLALLLTACEDWVNFNRPAGAETDNSSGPINPVSNSYSSIAYPIRSNNSQTDSNVGPQSVFRGFESNYPGLRFGDFLLKNNAWNFYNTQYSDWYQSIELENYNNRIVGKVNWDFGVQNDLNSIYAVSSYPELIYGIKSADEVSGSQTDIGLPVRVDQSPTWSIDYSFSYSERLSSSNDFSVTPDAEFNVALESFWHSSCDIQRSSNPLNDNLVFELMVWLKAGVRRPSGQPSLRTFNTSDGRSFDIYTKYSNPEYVAYVATSEQTTGSILYSEIIQDAVANANTYGIYPLQPGDCMANILLGPEIWHGAGTFYWNSLQINREY